MTDTIEGEYHLQGIREMASGFILKPDHTFQFFFVYGALDRYGTGTWNVKNEYVILNSAAKPGNEFSLVKSSKTDNDFINVVVDHTNPMLLRHVYCSLQNGAEGSWEQMSQHGDVQFPPQPVDSISLLFEFTPERSSQVPVIIKNHNVCVFRPEPWLTEVFLDNFQLKISGDGLKGKHPLLEGDQFIFSKC